MIGSDFIDPLLALAETAGAATPAAIGVFSRCSAVAFLAPGLGERTVPVRVRLGAAVAMTIAVAPAVGQEDIPSVESPLGLFQLAGLETLSGLVIGFSLRLSVFILQTVGSVAAQHLSMSMLFGPGLSHEQESPLSTILIAAGLAIAASGDFLFQIAASLMHSYDFFPFGVAPPAADIAEWAAQSGGAAIGAAFTLAAPFVILGFVYTLMLAAMSRAMPQLMAAFVGAPAIIFAGMILFAGAASVVLGEWSDILAALIADPVRPIR